MPLIHESPWTEIWSYREDCTCARCANEAAIIQQRAFEMNTWLSSFSSFGMGRTSQPDRLVMEPAVSYFDNVITQPAQPPRRARATLTAEQRFGQVLDRIRVSSARNRSASRMNMTTAVSQHDHMRTTCSHTRRNCTCANPSALLREPCYYCSQKQRMCSMSPEFQKKLSEIHVSDDYHTHECHELGRHGNHAQYIAATECYCDNPSREVKCVWHDPNQETWLCDRLGCATKNTLYALCCAMCRYRPHGYRVFRAETLTKLGEQVKTEE